jgi:hypothetical protein
MKNLIFLAIPLIITACSGGSDSPSSTSITPAPTLNLNAAYTDYIKTGGQENITVLSRPCSTQNGAKVAGLVLNATLKERISVTNPRACDKSIISGKQTNELQKRSFYDPTTLLSSTDGFTPKNYVYSNQQALPKSVTAGSAGTFYAYQDYNGGSIPFASGVVSYKVSADSTATLFVTFTDMSTLASTGAPYHSSSTNFRLNADNTLTMLSGYYLQ